MLTNLENQNPGRNRMYVSRLSFHTLPSKTQAVENELRKLCAMVTAAGGERTRILHTHYASLGAPDAVFEQEATDLQSLEVQMKKLTASADFQDWSNRLSAMLSQSPKRELYIIAWDG